MSFFRLIILYSCEAQTFNKRYKLSCNSYTQWQLFKNWSNFNPYVLAYLPNKTDGHFITTIFLKVALNTINQKTQHPNFYFVLVFHRVFRKRYIGGGGHFLCDCIQYWLFLFCLVLEKGKTKEILKIKTTTLVVRLKLHLMHSSYLHILKNPLSGHLFILIPFSSLKHNVVVSVFVFWVEISWFLMQVVENSPGYA